MAVIVFLPSPVSNQTYTENFVNRLSYHKQAVSLSLHQEYLPIFASHQKQEALFSNHALFSRKQKLPCNIVSFIKQAKHRENIPDTCLFTLKLPLMQTCLFLSFGRSSDSSKPQTGYCIPRNSYASYSSSCQKSTLSCYLCLCVTRVS